MPAYNEEESLPSVLADLQSALPNADILVVDDGSADATTRRAKEAGVAVATLPFNLGVGGALRTGFRYARRHGYKRALQFDADGQHLADEIEQLLEALDGGADLVIGSRFASGDHNYQTGRTRRSGMALLRVLVNGLLGQHFTDTSSGFRAFNTAAIWLFAEEYPAEYLGDTVEALLLAAYHGLWVAEVPIGMVARRGGRPSVRNLKLLYHYARLLLMVAFTASLRGRRSRRSVIPQS